MGNTAFQDTQWDALLDSVHNHECTPFLGAGISRPLLPSGAKLAEELAEEFGYPLTDTWNLARVGQYVATRQRDAVFPKSMVARRLARAEKNPPNFLDVDDPHGLLASLGLPIYVTTNWDPFMRMALEARQRSPITEVSRWNKALRRLPSTPEALDPTPQRPLVFHLHGHTGIPRSMVLTEDDYIEFVTELVQGFTVVVPERVQEALSLNSLMFVGYSLQDWNFHVLLRLLMNTMVSRSTTRLSVSVQLPPSEKLVIRGRQSDAEGFIADYLGTSNVNIHWGDVRGFLVRLRERYTREYSTG